MVTRTKAALIKAALTGEIDTEELSDTVREAFKEAKTLTPEEAAALREKAAELRANPERLRTLWNSMGLRI